MKLLCKSLQVKREGERAGGRERGPGGGRGGPGGGRGGRHVKLS